MGVVRGVDWGGSGGLPEGSPLASSDSELRRIVSDVRRSGGELPVVGLTGGDLWRTLGGPGRSRALSDDATLVAVDIGSALLDGEIHWFLAHLVARRSWMVGRCWVAANAAHHGSWNLAPRAHPGDGLLDLLESDLSTRQRLQAHRRLHAGNHVPHPGITYSRSSAAQTTFRHLTPVYLDGERITSCRQISVRLEPSALRLAL
ncbi:MAG: hypothetical protein ISR42_08815 [Acidimicrobiia bacterium]|nr:hypothetical protein [Actinomycetota bacterium]MBL6925469.1 hypothetical protein [Acidimicrobiia bacterium]